MSQLDKAALAQRFMALDETKQTVFLQKLSEKGIPFERLPIVAGHRPARIPLAPAQQRLWTIHQLEPDNTAYHLTAAFVLSGPLDVARLLRALTAVADRHESLRTRFVEENGQPQQCIEATSLSVEQRDVRALDDNARQTLADEHARRPFVLERDNPLRVQLLQVADQQWRLQLVMHHLVSDGWSMEVFFADLARAYLADGALSPLPIQYADYALWQKAWLDAGERDRQLAYWREQLGEVQPPLLIAHDRNPAQRDLRQAASLQWALPQHLQAPLQALARNNGTTLFTVVLAAWQWALAAVAGRRDIPVGVPVANRERSEVEALVGFFVNTLVVRGKPQAASTINEWVGQLHQTMLDAQAHQALPFDQLVASLSPKREPGETPLFQVLFNYQRRDSGSRNLTNDVTITPLAQGVPHALFDLALDVHESDNGALALTLTYAADRFHGETARRLQQAMDVVLDAFSDGQRCLGTIGVAGDDQRRLEMWGEGSGAWQSDSFVSLFSQQAAERGDAIALVHGDTRVSFAELEARSNQLARYLMEQGVKADDVVGVSFERGVTMIEAFLAVMKAGGAFLPLDPGYPADRLRYMLEDSGARLLVTSSDLVDRLPAVEAVQPIAIDTLSLQSHAEDSPGNEPHPDQLAYVIYTSGSTGKPKGVALTHGGLTMHVQTIGQRYGMTPDDVELQFASISFDGAVERWTVPLAFGSRVVIRDQALWSAEKCCQVLQQEGVTIACFPPSYMGPLLDWIEQEQPALNVRSWTLGGEAFTRETFERMQQVLKPQRILNGYGPTETVVTPMLWAAYEGDTLTSAYAPIGTAVGPRKLYVLDQDLNRVPAGVAGELYIGNEVGLARGYHERPDLTAERFLPDPFGEPGERMYRTGDLVKFRDDGVMEYLGRVDQQVKIRGFRIELGEIESRLLAFDQIRDAAVVAQPSPAGDRLVGYIVLRNAVGACLHANPAPVACKHAPAVDLEADAILEALSQSLPDYMVPSQLMTLEQLPLTPAGKVDRKALPEPQWQTASQGDAPQTDHEKVLAGIWQQLLGMDTISRDDHFFALGGDSILALQVVSRARQQGLALSPKELFEQPRLKDLAAVVVSAEATVISQEPLQGSVSLLPIQQHFFSLNPPSPSHWNQHLWLALDAPMERQALEATLHALYRQHDALRLRFTHNAEGWQQACLPVDTQPGELLWWREASDEDEVAALCEQTQQSLDIETGELLRALYVTAPEQPDRLLLVIHHLAVDGVSWRVLLEDLLNAYRQAVTGEDITLPERTHNVADWHQALQRWLEESGEQRLPFWQGQQPEETDGPLPTYGEKENASLSLDKGDTRKLLQDAPTKLGVTVPALLLTALARTLPSSPTANQPLIINLEGHGRENRLAPGLDLSRTLGWFTSLYPLALPYDSDPRQNLFAVSQQLKQTEADGGVGYGVLRYLSDSPLNGSADAPVTFNYLGQYHDEALIQGFTPLAGGGKPQADNNPMAAPLAINGQVVAGKLELVWDYASSHYDAQQIQHLCGRYRQELMALLALADAPREAQADPALVTPLNHSPDAPVLWCPHPVTGRVTGYQAIAAALEGQWQVNGLQSRSFLEQDWFDPSLEEMAERYYRTLRQAQPQGPYFLLGWSLGGALAMELTQRLEAVGESVAFLGLLDSYVPGHEVPEDQWTSPEAQQKLREHLAMLLPALAGKALDSCIGRLCDSTPPQWPEIFRCWMKEQSVDAMVADSAAQLLYAWAVEQHLRALCWGYQLPTLDTPVHSWWASEPPGRADTLRAGLQAFARLQHGETLQADHVSIVREGGLIAGLPIILKACVASTD